MKLFFDIDARGSKFLHLILVAICCNCSQCFITLSPVNNGRNNICLNSELIMQRSSLRSERSALFYQECAKEKLNSKLQAISSEAKCARMWPNVWEKQGDSDTDLQKFTIETSQALNEALTRHAGVSFAHANELIELGAVSVKGPRYDEFGEVVPRSSSSWQHVLEPTFVEAGSEIKVFLSPRLYPSCYCDNWEDRFLHESEEMIIVDKPAMLPCQPHQSNYMQSAPRCVQRALFAGKTDQPLYLCHRLDTVTEGCLVLAKTKAMVNRFVIWSTQGDISKEYLALTTQPVEAGIIEHYMYFGEEMFGPKLLRKTQPSRQEKSDWKVCKLEILGCEEVDPNEDAKIKATKDSNEVTKFYEVKVKLMTGRTHQVRAQLAALGAPIVGDELYIPMESLTLRLTDGSEEHDEKVVEAMQYCTFPKSSIALQASRIFLPGTKGTDIDVNASTPWWRIHPCQ